MRQLDAARVIIFDFDGVIIDSASIKTRAFYRMFQCEELQEFHRRNTGVSRLKKFRYYYETIRKQPVSDEQLQELNRQFNDIILEQIRAAELVPGVRELLEQYSRVKPLYICSGAPQSEIEQVSDWKGIRGYFRGLYGSPRLKPDSIRKILEREQVMPDEALFIGDGLTDYEASRATGVKFLGLVHDENRDFFEPLPIDKIYRNFLEP